MEPKKDNKKHTKNDIEKIFFEKGKEHGINSFKIKGEKFSSKIKNLINDMNNECIRLLEDGIRKTETKKGINIAIEGPSCCVGYAAMNIDRKVPLRQYFGMDKGQESNGIINRYSYGVGSGTVTVGSDIETTKTRPLTKTMKRLCTELETLKIVKIGDGMKKYKFNHVTVLFYMTNDNDQKVIELKKHCDIEMTPSNKYKNGNSQKYGTPTVVLALNHSKDIRFYKRYTKDNKKFESNDSLVGQMLMEHGDIFFLHPKDEHVLKRRVQLNGNIKFEKEEHASQFCHGVRSSINDGEEKLRERICVSVCFRESNVCRKYSTSNDLMIIEKDEAESVELIDGETTHSDDKTLMKNQNIITKRKHAFETKRNEIKKESNIKRINKKCKRYSESAKRSTMQK